MAHRLPPGLINIEEAQKKHDGQLYDVIGVCTDYLPPAQSRGTDFASKLTLWDATCLNSPEVSHDGMVVRVFAAQKCHPPIHEIGDVVVFRKLKTKSYGSQWIGLSNYDTKWTVVSRYSLADSADPDLNDVVLRENADGPHSRRQCERPSLAELKYAKSLLELKDPSTFRGPPKSTALDVATIIQASGGQVPIMKKKERMLKELLHPNHYSGHQFVDLLGEVRRVYLSSPVELQLTDYTENSLLFNYGEGNQAGDDGGGYIKGASQWVGPWGQQTITLTLWDEHGEHVRSLAEKGEVEIGMYMRVKNVLVKMDRNNGQLEGHLRGNSNNFGTTITLHRPREAETNDALKQLLERKRAYGLKQKSEFLGLDTNAAPLNKRPASKHDSLAADQPDEKKRKQSKKQKKKQEKRRQQQQAEKGSNTGFVVANDASKIPSNQHVRCEAIEIPLTCISSILDITQLERKTPSGNIYHLPFQNCRYKSKVKVVDFFPDHLEDFATPHRVSDYEALSDYDSNDDEPATSDFVKHNPDRVRWEWHFFLLVEDPRPSPQNTKDQSTMLLQVSGQDGDYLLNMEACDLRKSPQDIAKLKEKLFVLWGDLEEKKAEHSKSGVELKEDGVVISSKPFECLIKEYGVQARTESGRALSSNWERMFGLLKTNIG